MEKIDDDGDAHITFREFFDHIIEYLEVDIAKILPEENVLILKH